MNDRLEVLLPVYNEVDYIENLLKGIDRAIKKKNKLSFFNMRRW